MREIKFRAWCEGTHGVLTFTEPFMDYDVIIKDGAYANVESGWDIHGVIPSIPVMQFTGQTDKNGREIYEEDIARDHNGAIALIEFNNGAFFFGAVILINHDVEVIGNIYQNPELVSRL